MGIYYFQTPTNDDDELDTCMVHVRERQREFKVEVRDDDFSPPILVITVFFSKSALKTSEQKHESQQRESSYASGSRNDGNYVGKRTRHSKKLPYWCNYIAWLLVALCIACGAFFTILYALQWGKTKSEAWLVTFFLSFFQSLLLVQPIKVQNQAITATGAAA